MNVWHFWVTWKTLFQFRVVPIRKFEGTLFRLLRQLGIFCGFAAVLAAKFAQAATPAYVQSNSVDPQTPQTIVKVPYTAPQSAGNLNVVVVSWGDTAATVISVYD